MNIIDVIDKKRIGDSLSYEEIEYAVNGYVNGNIPDYQMSSLLMAIVLNGMIDEEVFSLTDIMIKSGEVLDLSSISNNIIDKHSTGGVGDKTTLVLGPLVASCGVSVAKMSGRGLGNTGGTIDKLESIPGFNVEIDFDSFVKQVKEIGIAVVSQMGNLVPADKKIYALRDVTATVSSIPLIASSIMSKKIASGANGIVLDVKVGKGALVQTIEEAEQLSNLMIKIGKKYNKEVVCVITDMDRPLGSAIGNSVEVMEAINVLRGKGPKDVRELVIALGSHMVSLGLNKSLEESKLLVETNLDNGLAFNKFLEFISAQGGNIDKLAISNKIFSIKSNKNGFIKDINTSKLGNIVKNIGGGRSYKDEVIDYRVGIILSKQLGDYVLEDEELAKVILGDRDFAVNELLECFVIADQVGEIPNLIKKVIN